MYLQGNVIDPSSGGTADGSFPIVNVGRSNELIVSELHGKYFEQLYRGNVFYGNTATAGVVIAISSTLTPTFSIWNPAQSGKLMVPICALIGWTATTAALGTFVWHSTTGAGAGLATAAPFSAFGSGTPVNANLGSSKASAMRFAGGGTTTLTAAASFYRGTGISTLPTTAATATASWWLARDEWDGNGCLQPGTAIHLFGSTAIAVTATVTLAWIEVPL